MPAVCIALALATAAVDAGGATVSGPPSGPLHPVPAELSAVPEMPETLPEGWYARLDTEKGTIVARLLPGQAPQSVAFFAALAEGELTWVDPFTGEDTLGHYYDGVVVHKAIAGQRFEAGDRTGTGRGAPPYYVPPEGHGPLNFHQPWRMGMTRSSQGRISGVTFFVTSSSAAWLTGRHPCFGDAIAGKRVIWEITSVKTLSDDTPREPVVIEKVRVHRVGDPDPLPDPVPFHPETREMRPKPLPDSD
jgi:peptidyl-prolyl cis-trans isomerase A (cyclophilin A)